MKNIYKIIFLLFFLVLLSTYTPKDLPLISKKKYNFFNIKKIEVVNNNLISKNSIIEKLEEINGKNIFSISKGDIEEPLMNIDFLEKIQVSKKYPNRIVIKIFETHPIAKIYKNEKKFYLDSSSKLTSYKEDLNYINLPNVFGEDAENYFSDFLKKLKNNNFPYQKIKNYYYYQIGRWDLQLLDDKTIKFPHSKIIMAIRKSIELLDHEEFKNYKVIDLRIHDKIIVE